MPPVEASSERVQAYMDKHGNDQCLWWFVNADLSSYTIDDIHHARHYSGLANLNVWVLTRLLTVRTEWSRKALDPVNSPSTAGQFLPST